MPVSDVCTNCLSNLIYRFGVVRLERAKTKLGRLEIIFFMTFFPMEFYFSYSSGF